MKHSNKRSGYDILRGHIHSQSRQMVEKLEEIRDSFEHGGNKGVRAEKILREFLRQYLPGYYRIGHGEVFNIDGVRSRQTDIVVANEHHPPLSDNWDLPQFFIIEGVACAGEIKTTLSSGKELREIFDAACQFKEILVELQPESMTYAQPEDLNRYVNRRPYFFLSFESKLTLQRITTDLTAWDNERRAIDRPGIDAVFVLNQGMVVNLGKGTGSFRISGQGGKPAEGYVIKSDASEVLPMLLMWMFTSIRKIQLWQPPIVSYLFDNRSQGPLYLTDDGRLERRGLAK